MRLENIIRRFKNLFRRKKSKKLSIKKYYDFSKLKEFQEIFLATPFNDSKFERLEFIGDRLINFIISLILMDLYPTRAFYSNFRNTVFSNTFFQKIVRANHIRDFYDYDRINKPAGDVLECICAIVYRKEGFDRTYKLFRKMIEPVLKKEAQFLKDSHWKALFVALTNKNHIKFEELKDYKESKDLWQFTINFSFGKRNKSYFGFSPSLVDARETAYQQAYRYLIRRNVK